MSRSKGSRYERRLVDFHDAAGYMVMKSPSSGSATKREQPDVLVGRDIDDEREAIAYEQKYIGKNASHVYLSGDELDALERFARIFGATPRVSVRWHGRKTFFVYALDDVRSQPTSGDAENYRVDIDAPDQLVELSDDGGPGVTPAAVSKGVRLDTFGVDESERENGGDTR